MVVNIRFISDLDFQIKAIESIVNLFDGTLAEVKNQSQFRINSNPKIISLDILNKNLKQIQEKNNIPVSKVASLNGIGLYHRPNFSIEMETGTGKTYIFLRTILELNRKHGFKKFIIIVPSVAIREGILANLKLTKSHFQAIYDKLPYNYRVFSSEKIADLSTFCRSVTLEIMVITIQSFNKQSINTLYEIGRDDILIANSGMEMLAETNPVLIIDEPHKMSSELSASAIDNLNPLFILRYSATHKDLNKSNLVYSLGPDQAHDMGLVKKIDVIGTVIKHESSLPFIKLIQIILRPKIKAKTLLKVKTAKGVVDKVIFLSKGDSLQEKTKNPAYRDLLVTNICGVDNQEYLEFSGGTKIQLNEAQGDTYFQVAKEQIENTIRTHFEKQLMLKKYGVKVLSLFFIDEVTDYQELDSSKKGGYEEISEIDPKKYLFVKKTFDAFFERLKINYEDWTNKTPEEVRGAYFSARKTFKSISQDKDKIDQILRDKEKLLSFDSPVAFIFTHSALGEGWDNPNVFNICTLRISHSEITKRQTIGRGLRIPVDQSGVRFENPSENVLTIVANESYEDFARMLQSDYSKDEISVPPVENRRDKVTARLRKDVFKGEFRDIWAKLRIKTKIHTEINTEEFIEQCKSAIAENLLVRSPIIHVRRASVKFEKNGIRTVERKSEPIKRIELVYSIPDIVTRISNETGLTRRTISRIILESGKLSEIFNNPEEYISKMVTLIKEKKNKMEIASVRYSKTKETFTDDIFDEEIQSYKKNIVNAANSVYDTVLCDNSSERDFAEKLSSDNQVTIFCKLPQNYYIQTPIGRYRPDWAIVFQREQMSGYIEPKLYLIRDTKFGYSEFKGTIKSIPEDEQRKIYCALKHFNALNNELDYQKADSYQNFCDTLPNAELE